MAGGGNSSVKAGQLLHWSPSQIKTFKLCNRRWGYDKIFRPDLRERETGPTNFGTRIHKELEVWADDGTVPDSDTAKAALAKLPPRDASTFESEVSISDPPLTAADIPARGFVDLVVTAPKVAVWDYKTRGNFDWTLTEAELAEDLQMVTYGVWADQRFNPARDPAFCIELNHLYLLRPPSPGKPKPPPKRARKPRDKPTQETVRRVRVSVPSSELRRVFERDIEPVVEEMSFAAQASEPEDLRPNYRKCWEYNKPCPYLMVCEGAPLRRDQGEQAMSEYESRTAPPAPGATSSTGVNPPDAAPNAFKLYVDCQPEQLFGFTRLEDEIARRLLLVGESGLLAHFKQNPPTGIILVNSQSPHSTAVVAVLAPMAVEVLT